MIDLEKLGFFNHDSKIGVYCKTDIEIEEMLNQTKHTMRNITLEKIWSYIDASKYDDRGVVFYGDGTISTIYRALEFGYDVRDFDGNKYEVAKYLV